MDRTCFNCKSALTACTEEPACSSSSVAANGLSFAELGGGDKGISCYTCGTLREVLTHALFCSRLCLLEIFNRFRMKIPHVERKGLACGCENGAFFIALPYGFPMEELKDL